MSCRAVQCVDKWCTLPVGRFSRELNVAWEGVELRAEDVGVEFHSGDPQLRRMAGMTED